MTHWQYETPVFNAADPIVCRVVALRPSLWSVVFNELQRLGYASAWQQDDPLAETPETVAIEIVKATDSAVLAGCFMIGEVRWLARAAAAWELVCDGSIYQRVDYPDLYAVIHANYIIDADTFAVPDLMDRFALGDVAPGNEAGQSEVTLTVSELPNHSHLEQDPGSVIVQAGTGAVALSDPGLPGSTGTAGSGNPFSIMPPYHSLIPVIIASYPEAG